MGTRNVLILIEMVVLLRRFVDSTRLRVFGCVSSVSMVRLYK